MIDCQNCKHLIACAEGRGVLKTASKYEPFCPDYDPRPKTNFDKVAESPESLAEFVKGKGYNYFCVKKKGIKCDPTITCDECFVKWLKQEAEDEE